MGSTAAIFFQKNAGAWITDSVFWAYDAQTNDKSLSVLFKKNKETSKASFRGSFRSTVKFLVRFWAFGHHAKHARLILFLYVPGIQWNAPSIKYRIQQEFASHVICIDSYCCFTLKVISIEMLSVLWLTPVSSLPEACSASKSRTVSDRPTISTAETRTENFVPVLKKKNKGRSMQSWGDSVPDIS